MNPGYIRYTTALVNFVAIIWLGFSGQEMTADDQVALGEGVNTAYVAGLALFNTVTMLYSKLVPSKPA